MSSLLQHYRRVTSDAPCPICRKPDWCLISDNGLESVCARVESDEPWGEAGWFHRPVPGSTFDVPPPNKKQYRSDRDEIKRFAEAWQEILWNVPKKAAELAENLNTSPAVLTAYQVGWRGDCASIPMYDEKGMCGVRFRNTEGRKWSLAGSKNGIFVPLYPRMSVPLVICEGASDTLAVASHTKADVYGLPCTTAGHGIIEFCVRACRRSRLVLIADSGEPGLKAMKKLYARIKPFVSHTCGSVSVIQPRDCDDVRDFLKTADVGELQLFKEFLESREVYMPRFTSYRPYQLEYSIR